MFRCFALLLLLLVIPFAAPAADGFRRALAGYDFSFPRDHGAHLDFQTEWWYYTGNLDADDGTQFGYELTIFRTATVPPGDPAAPDSPLAASQIYFGHFAISNITTEQHALSERIGRPGLGQAAASTKRLDLRLHDWTVKMDDAERMRLRAADGPIAIDLLLDPQKPFVIHGEDGAHQKSGVPGQASHYITYSRLGTTGTVTWDGEPHTVEGLSWMDHEFGSDALGDEQVGWDWFALQLGNGEDIMVYQIRERDGTVAPVSSGSLVGPEGARTEIRESDFEKEITGRWKSPATGANYPMGWRLRFPGYEGVLEVIPFFPEQEMVTERSVGTSYWEGAVRIEGIWRGKPVTGRGYVELVGYAEEFLFL